MSAARQPTRPARQRAALSPVNTSNNVEATFDIVAFDNVASTVLLVWTGFTDDDRRQRAKQYWPITRASNNVVLMVNDFQGAVCGGHAWGRRAQSFVRRGHALPALPRPRGTTTVELWQKSQ